VCTWTIGLAGKVNLRSTTRRSYAEHIQLYLRPGIGRHRLVDLTPEDVEALQSALRNLGRPSASKTPSPLMRRLVEARAEPTSPPPLSSARIRRVHATLMSALNSAVKRRLVPFNPAAHVELPSARRPRAVVWTEERVEVWRTTGQRPKVAVWTAHQTGLFLDHAVHDSLSALYHLIAFRGLRRGEAVGLPWCDVDLDRATVAALVTHKEQQLAQRRAWGEAWVDTRLVFTPENGSQIHPEYVTRRFERLIREAGLRQFVCMI
jgi:integrase